MSDSGIKSLTQGGEFNSNVTLSDPSDNKPDFRQLNLGSPVSPLRVGPKPVPSTSSSSSDSLSGRTGSLNATVNQKCSGEISSKSSPSFSSHRNGTGSSSSISSAGNLLPTGKVLKTGMMMNRTSKPEVLGFGTGHYGHGSIMRSGGGNSVSSVTSSVNGGGTSVSSITSSVNDGGNSGSSITPAVNAGENKSSRKLSFDPEKLKKLGNHSYKKGNYLEALNYFDRAIAIKPDKPQYHCNRSAALFCLNRLNDAINECYEAVKLDNGYMRAHRRLGSLLICLGQVENARKHLCFLGNQPDPNELKKLQTVEKHLTKCTDMRRVRDWSGVVRETDSAIASGANACSQLFACKSEALLKLQRLNEADLNLSNAPKFDATCSPSCSQTRFFGMLSEAYLLFVRAQIDVALGRFENAVSTIEKAGQIDPHNVEVAVLLQNITSVTRARARGNDFFKSERLTEACSAYSEGLRLNSSNPVLLCNRAACWFKLGQFERSLDDCNEALRIHPNYTKALLRRAATFSKLDRWAECVNDYEILRKEVPNDNEIAESLFHAQVALKKFNGEDVSNMKFGGEVEQITNPDHFIAAVAAPEASVVLFKTASDIHCKQITPTFDTLCARFPCINFFKVDLDENPIVASAENVKLVPTVKIYKKGNRVMEMVCPTPEVLESLLRHSSF